MQAKNDVDKYVFQDDTFPIELHYLDFTIFIVCENSLLRMRRK